MSEQAAHEPTMEEILASIRRIISEDDAPAEEAKAVKAEPVPEPADSEPEIVEEPEDVTVQAEPEADEIVFDEPSHAETSHAETNLHGMGELDVLELTDPVASEKPVVAEPEYKSEPEWVAPEVKLEPSRGLISETTAKSAMSYFGQLTNGSKLPAEGRTIEDLVVELLQPMLKEWLDQNLEGIVEDAVRSEVERLARQARR